MGKFYSFSRHLSNFFTKIFSGLLCREIDTGGNLSYNDRISYKKEGAPPVSSRLRGVQPPGAPGSANFICKGDILPYV